MITYLFYSSVCFLNGAGCLSSYYAVKVTVAWRAAHAPWGANAREIHVHRDVYRSDRNSFCGKDRLIIFLVIILFYSLLDLLIAGFDLIYSRR